LKYYFIIILLLIAGLFVLQSRLKNVPFKKPVFLIVDEIADKHTTFINTKTHSYYKPTKEQIQILEKDFRAIWAHLNNVYSTNDIEAGKEYYTEDWFKYLNNEHKLPITTNVFRKDIEHNLHIINWSFDGLVCNIMDSNVVFKYYDKNSCIDSTKSNIAMALLIQGDHWRIDGIKYLK
jgi:hypothetical protein